MLRLVMVMAVFFVLSHQTSSAAVHDNEALAFSVAREVPQSQTIEDMCCFDGESSFSTKTITSIRSHYGEPSMWLRVLVPLKTEMIQLTPILDDAKLFLENRDGGWQTFRVGDSVSKALISTKSPYMAFRLPPDRTQTDVFIRIVQPTAVTIGVTRWSSASFSAMQEHNIIVKLFLLGGVCAIILYNIFVSFLIRKPVFLLNAMTVISMLFLSLYLSGFGQFYIWPNMPNLSNLILVLSMFFSILFGSMFVRMFLWQGNKSRFKGYLLYIPPILAIIALISYVFLPYWVVQFCMIVLGAIFVLSSFGASVWQASRGNRNALILCFPIVVAIVPGFGLSVVEKIWGIAPAFVGDNGFETALFIEAIILSLAMASTVRLAEMETIATHNSMIKLRIESTRKVIVGQDSERERIAKELHDGVSQDFLMVLGKLKTLVSSARIIGNKDELSNTITSAEMALDNLRNISRHMHPTSIEHLGLKKAIQIAVEDLASAYQIDTLVEFDFEQTRFSPEWQLHVYRVVQSCISNLVLHSQATYCHAFSSVENGRFLIVVEDDGVGFDEFDVLENSVYGLGLTSIRERAIVMDGILKIGNSELGGAKIELRMPLTTPDGDGKPGGQD